MVSIWSLFPRSPDLLVLRDGLYLIFGSVLELSEIEAGNGFFKPRLYRIRILDERV
ncbi:MAG TPA: hypothetical protein VH415_10255 [Nitrososphaeraceae archaeon]